MKELFTLDDLSTMTMLSTRTLRNYISQGFLNGKKEDGMWRFTAEEVDAFLKEDFVNQSIQSKKNGIVYRYMCDQEKEDNSVCSIIDYPNINNKDAETIRERMIELVNSNQYGRIAFSYAFREKKKQVRIILVGEIRLICSLMNDYNAMT